MSPDDERHGTEAGYWTHRRHHESACRPCRIGHYRANTTAANADAELTGGRWVTRSGGIKVWRYDNDDAPPSPINRRVPVTLALDEIRRGYSQYQQGFRSEFAVTAYREYHRLHKRAKRGAA